MDHLKNTIEKVFQNNREKPSKITPNISISHFLDKNDHSENDPHENTPILSYNFEFSVNNNLNFLLYCEDFSFTENSQVNFDDFKIKKIQYRNDLHYLIFDSNFTNEKLNDIITETAISRCMFEHKSFLNKYFIIKDESIHGYLIRKNIDGEFLINLLNNTTNLKVKTFLLINLISKLQFIFSLNIEYYDINLRSAYVIFEGENLNMSLDNYKDIVILNKKVNSKFQNDFNKKIKYAECLNYFFQAFNLIFDTDHTLIKTLNNPKQQYEVVKRILEKVNYPKIFKKDILEILNKIDNDPDNINYKNVLNKIENLFRNIYENISNNEINPTESKNNTLVVQRKEQLLISNFKSKNQNKNPKYYTAWKTTLTIWSEHFKKILDPKYQIKKYFLSENQALINYPIDDDIIIKNPIFTSLVTKKFLNELKTETCSFSLTSSKILLLEHLLEHLEESNKLLTEAENDYNTNNYLQAKDKYEKCLSLRMRSLGENNKDTAVALNGLAGVQLKLGKYTESLALYFQAMSIYTNILGDDHVLVASVLHNIGLIYDLINIYDKALEYYKRALEIKLVTLGENNHSTASTYYNIGGIFDIMSNHNEALRYYQITIEIYNKLYGEENTESATVFNNVGLVYDKLNQIDLSIKYYRKSIEISTKLLGEIHPLIATSYNNLGLVFFKCNNTTEAISNFEKSIFIRENLSELGFFNSDTASSYNNLAGIYFKQGRFHLAYQNYKKCLNANIDLIGENTPETATAYNNIGLVSIKLKSYEEALTYFKKSYQIRSSIFGEMQHDSISVLFNIAGAYFKLKDDDLCIQNYKMALAGYQKLYGNNSTELINIYNNLGHSYLNVGMLDDALESYNKSLNICVSEFGNDSFPASDAYLNLAKYYEHISNKPKANEFIRKSISIRESNS